MLGRLIGAQSDPAGSRTRQSISLSEGVFRREKSVCGHGLIAQEALAARKSV